MRNESDRDRIVRLGRQALKNLDKDKNWTWWLDVGEAILIGRQECMHAAGTNQPQGGDYNRRFGLWLQKEKLEFDKSDRARLMQVMDNRPAIEAWRATLTVAERRKLNHPSSVWRKWQAATRSPLEKPDAKPTLRDTNMSLSEDLHRLTGENEQLRLRIAEQDEELEAARGTKPESDAELSLDAARDLYFAAVRRHIRTRGALKGEMKEKLQRPLNQIERNLPLDPEQEELNKTAAEISRKM